MSWYDVLPLSWKIKIEKLSSMIREDAVKSTDEDASKKAQPAFEVENSYQSAKKAREVCVETMKRLFM